MIEAGGVRRQLEDAKDAKDAQVRLRSLGRTGARVA